MLNNVVLLYLCVSLSFFLCAPQPAPRCPEPESVISQQQTQHPQRLDLHTAEVLTLQTELNGIGKAKAIVAYREADGLFASVDELLAPSHH